MSGAFTVERNTVKRALIAGVAALVGLAALTPPAVADDSVAPVGAHALASAQPRNAGHRLQDIRTRSPQTDPYARYLRAEVPLQPRIPHDPSTQAHPELDAKAQVMLMQGDYGNSFFGNFRANDGFAHNVLNFWQYADYWSPCTAQRPHGLHSPSMTLPPVTGGRAISSSASSTFRIPRTPTPPIATASSPSRRSTSTRPSAPG